MNTEMTLSLREAFLFKISFSSNLNCCTIKFCHFNCCSSVNLDKSLSAGGSDLSTTQLMFIIPGSSNMASLLNPSNVCEGIHWFCVEQLRTRTCISLFSRSYNPSSIVILLLSHNFFLLWARNQTVFGSSNWVLSVLLRIVT